MENFESQNILVAQSEHSSDGQISRFACIYKKKPFSLSRALTLEIEMLVFSEEVGRQLVNLVCSVSFFSGLPASSALGKTFPGAASFRGEVVFQLGPTSGRIAAHLNPSVVGCASWIQEHTLVAAPPVRAFVPDRNRPKPSFLDSQVNLQKTENSEWIFSEDEQSINDFIGDPFTQYPSLEESEKYISPPPWYDEFCKEKMIKNTSEKQNFVEIKYLKFKKNFQKNV